MISDKKVCLLIGKAFGNAATASMTNVLQAVKWAVKRYVTKANVRTNGTMHKKLNSYVVFSFSYPIQGRDGDKPQPREPHTQPHSGEILSSSLPQKGENCGRGQWQ